MKNEKMNSVRRRAEQLWVELSVQFMRALGITTRTIWISAPLCNGDAPSDIAVRAPLRVPLSNRLDYIQRWSPQYDHWLPILMRIVGAASPDETIIDIGANVGDTVIAGRLAGCEAHMVGIEASPLFAGLFKENIKRNEHLSGTTNLVEALVIGRSKHVKFEMHRGGTGKTEARAQPTESEISIDRPLAGAATLTVKTVCLDDLQIKKCSLLKIDTDGFDAHILDGGMDWIATARPIVWAEAEVTSLETVALWRNVLEAIHSRKYEKVMVFDNEGALCFSGRFDQTAIAMAVDLIDYSYREMQNFLATRRLKKPVHYFDIALFPASRVALWEEFDRHVRKSDLVGNEVTSTTKAAAGSAVLCWSPAAKLWKSLYPHFGIQVR